ncbi:hypothetical protein [Massilia sp. ST3]|uniref:hypothetical protein n=1 Tax=Massilia sp. ST3 TaxID=2824903 RepID=UPI001B81E3DF|nr:hypothetical protein [Massilia sp. ST3]MBQ5949434.1 hypothetical protein [Massilia sp. ST3]
MQGSYLIVPLFALALAAPVHAQDNPLGTAPACGPAQDSQDGRSLAAVAPTLYDIVSGPAGAKKDWERMFKMFAPGALVTPTSHGAGGFGAAPQTPRQFAALNERLFGQRGFYEREVAHQVSQFGHIAHVYSSYETRDRPDGPVLRRGVNSLQLLHDGARWCVLSVTWDAETPAHPIPAALDHTKP